MLDIENIYKKNIIENNGNLQTYLIEPPVDKELLDYIGVSRAKSFSRYFDFNYICNDIEKRDKYYFQFLLWDASNKEIIGGQRILFHKEGLLSNNKYSYLEHTYPGIITSILENRKGFAEIGRTFLSPNYQNTGLLKELIRGFTRVPEAFEINFALGLISFDQRNLKSKVVDIFLKSLGDSQFKGELVIPKPRFDFEIHINNDNNNYWDGFNLKKLEKNLIKLDSNFNLPDVLIPYRVLCSVNYEGVSYAKDYNQILQLLFSGSSENITEGQRRRMPDYINTNLKKIIKRFY